MRVMKSRKVLKHNLLIEEVCAIYECMDHIFAVNLYEN